MGPGLAALDALRAGWDIADSLVLFGGSSGGSVFLAASFYPLFGDRFPGGYALSCGGDASRAGGLDWDSSDPALVGETTLFFTYGYKDFAVTDVLEAISLYEGEGIPVDVKVVPRPAKKAAATAATSGAALRTTGSAACRRCGRDTWESEPVAMPAVVEDAAIDPAAGAYGC
ncbi:MAG: hypothetical protein ACOX6T_25690 [Myxococcales bacterium]|jgi:hypothetical protein